MRRNDVASTSFRCHVPTRFLINQCQVITFLILKSDNIENSRIDLKTIILQVPSNIIKVTFIIILYPPTWYICDLWVDYWGVGVAKGMLAPLSNYWGASPPPSYAYVSNNTTEIPEQKKTASSTPNDQTTDETKFCPSQLK